VKRVPIIIGALVLAAIAVGGFLLLRQQTVEVRTAQARIGEAVELVYATGFVEPEQPVTLSARITAPVRAVAVEEGARITAGQSLIVLDSAEQQDLLAQARAQRRGLELKEQRIAALFRQGWVARSARDEVVATASAARAAEAAAAARVRNSVVYSPMSGIVLKRDVEAGDLAVPGKALMQLGDPARVRITATADERDIVGIRPGQETLISSDSLPGRVLRGFVKSITPAGDPAQRSFRVRLALAEPAELPFGLTVEANIVTQRRARALLVPAAAYSPGRVWTVDSDGHARQRKVLSGIVGLEKVEIVSGLDPGDTVIVSPPANLAEGSRVRVVK